MIKYNRRFDRNSTVCYVLVDNTSYIKDGYAKEITKNIADYTISNITDKGYDVFVGLYEDMLLHEVSTLGYSHAVVFSTGTEFLWGENFFDNVNELIKQNFLVAGHVLDRADAYYELHKQCYVINLEKYKELGCPEIGQQQLGSTHTQDEPMRSIDNYHDDYTPVAVVCGFTKKTYNHKCHGWNILSKAFDIDAPVLVFDSTIRNNKRYYYPEDNFLNECQWLYYRQTHAQNNFVHTSSNELAPSNFNNKVTQVFTPASGLWWLDCLDNTQECQVVFYDYNQRALDHWKEHCPKYPHISYEFVLVDLLGENLDLTKYITSEQSLINLSNIFCYEATAPFTSLKYRLHQENSYIEQVKNKFPNSYLYFCNRASSGFTNATYFGQAKEFKTYSLAELQIPTWHMNGDWSV